MHNMYHAQQNQANSPTPSQVIVKNHVPPMPPSCCIQFLFRSTLPDLVVAVAAVAAGCVVLAAAVFFVPALVTLFLSVFITVRFAAGAGAAGCAAALVVLVAALAPVFLTTVAVLPSLDSLIPLILRVVRVAGALVMTAGAAAAFLVFIAGARPAAELAVEDVVALRVTAARVDRAFSTMLLSRFVDAGLAGDAGRAISDLVGETGRSRALSLELDDVGESTLDGSGPASPGRRPRNLFLGFSMPAS